MFVRTSMLLEHVVSEECRRCFQCVAACPQVNRALKEYVRSFRRIERASHWDLLASYLVLMATGILINHWATGLPSDLRYLFGLTHRVFAVGLLVAPLILVIFDPHHFVMALNKALSWPAADRLWFRDTWTWLTSLGKRGALQRGAFNPGQRLWYLYVPAAVFVLGATGAIKWIGPDVLRKPVVAWATWIHAATALATDILMVLHIYLKLIWPTLRETIRGTKLFFEFQRHRKAAAILRAR